MIVLETRNTVKKTDKELEMLELKRKQLYLKKARMKKDHRNQTASWLARSFDVVAFPTFKSEDMVKKEQENGARRKIRRSTARLMNEYAFGQFRRALWGQCLKYTTVCFVTNEAYTSQVHYRCLQKQTKSSAQVLICKTSSCDGERNQRDENSCVCQWIKLMQTRNGTLE